LVEGAAEPNGVLTRRGDVFVGRFGRALAIAGPTPTRDQAEKCGLRYGADELRPP
jgi:hypothetical protein